jgi:hypothetical protein
MHLQRFVNRPVKKKKMTPAKTLGDARHLIRVDGKKIRSKIQSEYERATQSSRQCQEQLESFYSKDEPEYSKLYHARFGALLTESRELELKLHELQSLFDEVDTIYFLEGFSSRKKAYQAYLKRLEIARKWQEKERARADQEQPDEEQEESGEDQGGRDKKNQEEWTFEDFLHEFFEHQRRAQDERSRREAGPADSRKKSSAGTNARVKQVYRQLVRKLHPDIHATPSPGQLELWHQTQEAYEQDDLQALEAILAMCEIEEKGTHLQASMSALMEIVKQHKKSLRKARSELREAKKTPAWGFAAASEMQKEALLLKRGEYLRSRISLLKGSIGKLEREIESWKQSPRAKKARKRMSEPSE